MLVAAFTVSLIIMLYGWSGPLPSGVFRLSFQKWTYWVKEENKNVTLCKVRDMQTACTVFTSKEI